MTSGNTLTVQSRATANTSATEQSTSASGSKDSPRAGSCVWLVVGGALLVAFSSAPYMSLARGMSDADHGHTSWPFVATYWVPALAGGALFMAHCAWAVRRRLSSASHRFNIAVCALSFFSIWVLASTAWTTSVATPRWEALLVLLVISTGAWFGVALPPRVQIGAVFIAMQALTIGSLLTIVFSPSARSSQFIGDRSWIGLFGNPNSLGPVATLAVLSTAGVASFCGRRSRLILIGIVSIDLVVAVGATSVTAWLALFSGIAASSACRSQGARSAVKHIRSGGATAIALVGLVIVASTGLLLSRSWTALLGKDATLSGRTTVWRYTVESLESRWLFGFGFGSFWDDPEVRSDYMASTGLDWVLSSHSTFVDTLLYFGAVGFALMAASTVLGIGALIWAARDRDPAKAWWVGVAAFTLVENAAESMMLMHSVFWLLLVASASSWAQSSRGEKFGITFATRAPTDPVC